MIACRRFSPKDPIIISDSADFRGPPSWPSDAPSETHFRPARWRSPKEHLSLGKLRNVFSVLVFSDYFQSYTQSFRLSDSPRVDVPSSKELGTEWAEVNRY